MRLVVQIPCLDEAETLPRTLDAIPRALPGIERISVIVVDDGSRDETVRIAEAWGASVVSHPSTRGLGAAFMLGIDASLAKQADIIVNTDGDNQYRGEDIGRLVAPILAGRADIVIGARPIREIREFSWVKKALQRIGSAVVRWLSGVRVVDATSGFRAYSREAALHLAVFSRYTYTLESIVQAATSGLRIESVPIDVNVVSRRSRLARNSLHYVWRAGIDLARVTVVYRPFRFFIVPACIATAVGVVLVARFVWFLLTAHGGSGHVQSLVVAGILIGAGGALAVVALVSDLLAINRRLLEEMRLEYRRRRFRDAGIRVRAEDR